jgi:hypothetical protein
VLLIADCGEVLGGARAALRRAGHATICTSDVDLALGLLKRAAYDVVVADLDSLKRAEGAARVYGKLSLLLYGTREVPVVLGSSNPNGSGDLLDLSDTEALLQRVQEAASCRCADDGLLDEEPCDVDALVFGGHMARGYGQGTSELFSNSGK